MQTIDARDGARDGAVPSISLLDAEPGLAQAIRPDDAALARRVLTVPKLELPAGPWQVPSRDSWRAPVSGFVVIEGALARHVAIGSRTATQFLGPGDIVQPWAGVDDVLPCETTWSAAQPTVLAVLDARVSLATTKWPSIAAVLAERVADQLHRAAAHTAISHLPRVEHRILAVLWQLADRFGTARPEGVELRLRLTHSVIGDCVGARRPTVTLAMRELTERGLIERRDGATWLLTQTSRELLSAEIGGASGEEVAA